MASMQGAFGPVALEPFAAESFAVFAVPPGGVGAAGARLGMLAIGEVIGAAAPGGGVPPRVQRRSLLPTLLWRQLPSGSQNRAGAWRLSRAVGAGLHLLACLARADRRFADLDFGWPAARSRFASRFDMAALPSWPTRRLPPIAGPCVFGLHRIPQGFLALTP